MKSSLVGALLLGSLLSLPAQSRNFAIVERGAHHRVWKSTTLDAGPDGSSVVRSHSYVELATGMHYENAGQWEESEEIIEPAPGGAVAHRGAHKVAFAANLNTQGAIHLVTPDMKDFRSHILGLAFTDTASGRSVMIAELKDSLGKLTSANQVLYADAFTDLKADVRYTYFKGGFEQDIIFREIPPSPADFGLNPDTTILEVYTEFLNPPEPTKSTNILRAVKEPLARANMVEPDLIDETLDFGLMQMGAGTAFPLTNSPLNSLNTGVPVGKTWERRDGRTLLIEKVEYQSVVHHLNQLPISAAIDSRSNAVRQVNIKRNSLPKGRLALPGAPKRIRSLEGGIETAQNLPPKKGFVLDYQILSSASNYTFQGDSTYYVTGNFDLTGTTIFEGGAVIKFTNSSAGVASLISLRGAAEFRTSVMRPVIFTGKDDDTVGETIAGSTGILNGWYGDTYLRLRYVAGDSKTVSHCLFRSASRAIWLYELQPALFRHCQFYRCDTAIATRGVLTLRNVLLSELDWVFYGDSTNAVTTGEHITISKARYLIVNTPHPLLFTNSILINITNGIEQYVGSNVVTNNNVTNVFTSLGAGYCYLPEGSSYRDAGTTMIDPVLAMDLHSMSVSVPLILSNTISTDTVLAPRTARDTNAPDLGYHYPAVDYLINNVAVTNATLVLTNGVVVATYGSNGFWLQDNSRLFSEGTPLNHNRFTRSYAVQERNTNWGGGTVASVVTLNPRTATNSPPVVRLRFTSLEVPANGGYHAYANSNDWNFAELSFKDCQFGGGSLFVGNHGTAFPITLTNNLLERTTIDVVGNGEFTAFNNLFYGGPLTLDRAANSWLLKDNAFDNCILTNIGLSLTHDYNAYIGMTSQLTPTNATDIVLSSLTYQSNWLGRFYQPAASTLINAGSQNATNAGLYHFTTTTNQVRETNTVVDIGFHYAALTATGQIWDTDTDGLFDYVEDVNGNGSREGAESNFNVFDTDGDGINDYFEAILGGNPTTAASTDTNGVAQLKVYTPLK